MQPAVNGWQNHAGGSAKTSEAVPSEASLSSLSEASLQTSIPDRPGPKAGEERRGEFRHAVKDATSLQPVQEDQHSQRDANRDQAPGVGFVWVQAPPRGGTQPAKGGKEPASSGAGPAKDAAEKEESAVHRPSDKPETSLAASSSNKDVTELNSSGGSRETGPQPSADKGNLLFRQACSRTLSSILNLHIETLSRL